MNNTLKLQAPTPDMLAELRKNLRWLDFYLEAGEEPWEMENSVCAASHLASIIFFGWLVIRGIEVGAEVLADLAKGFVENLYLVPEEGKGAKRHTLAAVTKPRLEKFLQYIEFSVPEKLWEGKINPFDGLLLFYQFLEEVGYEANLKRRTKALSELKRSMNKRPCSMPQPGAEHTH